MFIFTLVTWLGSKNGQGLYLVEQVTKSYNNKDIHQNPHPPWCGPTLHICALSHWGWARDNLSLFLQSAQFHLETSKHTIGHWTGGTTVMVSAIISNHRRHIMQNQRTEVDNELRRSRKELSWPTVRYLCIWGIWRKNAGRKGGKIFFKAFHPQNATVQILRLKIWKPTQVFKICDKFNHFHTVSYNKISLCYLHPRHLNT